MSRLPDPQSSSSGLPAGSPGKVYWRSLDELSDTPEFREFVGKTMPMHAEELVRTGGGVDRRKFLQLMAASLALAGLSGCRRPSLKILPYSRKPESVIEGMPTFYASALPKPGSAVGILVESHQGRPTKIEGNPLDPNVKGGSDAQTQAAILDLYDPDRSRTVIRNGETTTWDEWDTFGATQFAGLREAKGKGLAFLAEDWNSPSFDLVRDHIRKNLPEARWYVYEAIGPENARAGAALAFGSPLIARPKFDKAKVIVSLDCDFLGVEDEGGRALREFSEGRRVTDRNKAEMNRLYVVENHFTPTGGMADHRLKVPASRVRDYAIALARAVLGESNDLKTIADALAAYKPEGEYGAWVAEVAADLKAHAGASLVVAGRRQPAEVHALVHAINAALGNLEKTVTFRKSDESPAGSIADLVKSMNGGEVNTLVILGGNPVHNTPTDLGFTTALGKVKTSIHHGLYYDETSSFCRWHLPAAHTLESWGDARTPDGIVFPIQPLIEPLFGGRPAIEIVAQAIGFEPASAHEIARRAFAAVAGETGFEANWRKFLHDGLYAQAPRPSITPKLDPAAIAKLASEVKPPAAPLGPDNFELVLQCDSKIWDGRFANNGWLQEAPDPITKLTWDNAALISPKTAEALGIESGIDADVVRLTVGEASLEIAAFVMPGHADNSCTVALGYGRSHIGRVGIEAGRDAFVFRSAAEGDIRQGLKIVKTGAKYPLASIQYGDQDRIPPERMDQIIHEQDLADYREHGDTFGHHGGHGTTSPTDVPGHKELIEANKLRAPVPDQQKEDMQERPPGLLSGDHQWGMVIDLNACVGCNACVVACQSENNIPIVGKDEVRRGRAMHWIRNDRYFSGDPEDPGMVHQPVACVQCENAPCELVCPVNATIHSDEGLNLQAYNRCVGTRYCSNNCPYKVRRFNWFNYNERPLDKLRLGPLTEKGTAETLKMRMNPDVTVRIRGVMEKCTYCIQRIERAKIGARVAAGQSSNIKVPDGAITPACAQSCSAQAIVFGDLSDPKSRVSKLKVLDRDYTLLSEVNTKPRTTYLSRLRNPNPKMPGAERKGVEAHA